MSEIVLRAYCIDEDWHLTIVDENGDPIDVSDATVNLTLRRREDGELLLDEEAAANVGSGLDGQVTYAFTAEELDNDAAGVYTFQVEIVSEGDARSVHVTDTLRVIEDWGEHSA